MAPEQIQICIEICNLCAETGDAYLRAQMQKNESDCRKEALLRDAVAICRITAASLANVSEGAKICSEACAQLCELGAQVCASDKGEEAAQCERVFRHTAQECQRLAAGLPSGQYLA